MHQRNLAVWVTLDTAARICEQVNMIDSRILCRFERVVSRQTTLLTIESSGVIPIKTWIEIGVIIGAETYATKIKT